MNGDIECEIRSVVPAEKYQEVLERLKREGKFVGQKQRFSVMFFGYKFTPPLDVRVRVTNGEAEVVVKRGKFHSPDRTETSLPIKIDQFIDLVKIFYHFGFDHVKVGPRESYKFNFLGDIEITLGRGGDYVYTEIEKMATPDTLDAIRKELEDLAGKLDLPIASADDFYTLCQKLTEEVDWDFFDSPEDYVRLEKELKAQQIK